MLPYMAGLLYQTRTTGLEFLLQLCLIVVALQSMFQYSISRRVDQATVPQDLEAGNTVKTNVLELSLMENIATQEQQRMQTEDQQTQTSEQILPSTAMQQDDDPKECTKIALKVSLGIGGLTGSMIGVLVGAEHKKSDSIFLKISNLMLWASFVLCVILMVLTLLSIKNKQLVIIVKFAMYVTIVSLILSVVDVFLVYMEIYEILVPLCSVLAFMVSSHKNDEDCI